jgi:hypothetical protein
MQLRIVEYPAVDKDLAGGLMQGYCFQLAGLQSSVFEAEGELFNDGIG